MGGPQLSGVSPASEEENSIFLLSRRELIDGAKGFGMCIAKSMAKDVVKGATKAVLIIGIPLAATAISGSHILHSPSAPLWGATIRAMTGAAVSGARAAAPLAPYAFAAW